MYKVCFKLFLNVQIDAKFLIVETAYFLNMVNHPIKKGPEGGHHQCSHGKVRGLLADKKIHTGPQKGHFQTYDGGEKRYLLKVSKVPKKT